MVLGPQATSHEVVKRSHVSPGSKLIGSGSVQGTPLPTLPLRGKLTGIMPSRRTSAVPACHTSSGFTLPNMPHQLHRWGSLPLSARRVSVARPGFNEWHNKPPRIPHSLRAREPDVSLTQLAPLWYPQVAPALLLSLAPQKGGAWMTNNKRTS
jgi:hypothetical protein